MTKQFKYRLAIWNTTGMQPAVLWGRVELHDVGTPELARTRMEQMSSAMNSISGTYRVDLEQVITTEEINVVAMDGFMKLGVAR